MCSEAIVNLSVKEALDEERLTVFTEIARRSVESWKKLESRSNDQGGRDNVPKRGEEPGQTIVEEIADSKEFDNKLK